MTAGTATATSVNPATGDTIATYPFIGSEDLDDFLAEVAAGFATWSRLPIEDRCSVLTAMARLLRHNREELAQTETAEMGKPIAQSREEVTKAADVMDWYAERGQNLLAEETTELGDAATVRYLPLGPILAVEPWNFPIWQIMRGGIGILLAGNAYVLKPAPNVVGTSLLLERLWREAGLPTGAFSVLNADNEVVSQAIEHDTIAGVTVTGSVGAGSAIAAQAGRQIKKTVLELGGTDPFIVLPDADIDAAANAAVTGRFANAGQVCISAKRMIVHRDVVAEFTEKLAAQVRDFTIGDPTDESTYIGPIARADLRDEIHRQIRKTVDEGATLITGGDIIDGPGSYIEPTVLADVTPEMTAFREEIFGPVAAIIPAADVEEAIALANDSIYGLDATVYTEDLELAADIASRLQVGGVFINRNSASDPRIPIGGVKKSGYGRELSHFGVTEFTNVQAVWSR